MSGISIKRTLSVLAVLFCAFMHIDAQNGASTSYTPYSMFGVGDILQQGSAYNKGMAGIGIATRNRKVINTLNPAAVTARDSLAFMGDFGLAQNNKLMRQGDKKSASNVANINDIVLSFPIYRSSAMMFGLAPYSGLGYATGAYLDDPDIIGHTGNIASTSKGSGSMYQFFGAAGVTFWKRLSLGAEFIYYFGNLKKISNLTFSGSTFNGISSGYDLTLHATTGKFGLQYEQPIGRTTLSVGATYSLDADLKGFVTDYMLSSGSLMTDTLRYHVDTLMNDPGRVKIAGDLGIGICLRQGERWRAEFDYVMSDWSKSGIDAVTGFRQEGTKVFSAARAESFRFGMEYVPNVNDIRYYLRRVSYKAGAYFNKEYYRLDGNQICSAGITLGVTLPVLKAQGHNGLSFAVDFGQRGALADNMIRERYVNFTVGLNAFDIWFQKHHYN